MWSGTPLFPEVASTIAPRVDALYFFLVALTLVFSLGIAAMIVFFAIRYHRKDEDAIGTPVHGALALELGWTFVPFVISLAIFGWGASIFFAMASPPAETLNVYAVGKQWMWKFQHLDGRREINELHVPVNRAVKVIMASEDVIHDLYVPAFRVKADVIPGRYTTIWFNATKPGRYQLFCAEYCGTKHSGMIGSVVVMDPNDYQAWLNDGAPQGSLAEGGAKQFTNLACYTCHKSSGNGRGPQLDGVYGKTVTLASGESVTVDEAYLRESILNPSAKVVQGYQPVMPTFQGLVSEEQLLELIEYVKSLQAQAVPQPTSLPQQPQPQPQAETKH